MTKHFFVSTDLHRRRAATIPALRVPTATRVTTKTKRLRFKRLRFKRRRRITSLRRLEDVLSEDCVTTSQTRRRKDRSAKDNFISFNLFPSLSSVQIYSSKTSKVGVIFLFKLQWHNFVSRASEFLWTKNYLLFNLIETFFNLSQNFLIF